MTDAERAARIRAVSNQMIAELTAKADAGADLAVEQAYIVRVRALTASIGEAQAISIQRADLALFADLAVAMLQATAEIAVDREASRAAAPSPRPTLH